MNGPPLREHPVGACLACANADTKGEPLTPEYVGRVFVAAFVQTAITVMNAPSQAGAVFRALCETHRERAAHIVAIFAAANGIPMAVVTQAFGVYVPFRGDEIEGPEPDA